jgi:hypothetical protein
MNKLHMLSSYFTNFLGIFRGQEIVLIALCVHNPRVPSIFSCCTQNCLCCYCMYGPRTVSGLRPISCDVLARERCWAVAHLAVSRRGRGRGKRVGDRWVTTPIPDPRNRDTREGGKGNGVGAIPMVIGTEPHGGGSPESGLDGADLAQSSLRMLVGTRSANPRSWAALGRRGRSTTAAAARRTELGGVTPR